MDIDEDFLPITIKDIEALFEGKDCSGKKRNIVDLVYEMASTPALVGLDFADIELVVRGNSKFEFLRGTFNKFLKDPEKINKASSAILIIRVGEDATIGQVSSVVDALFSDEQEVVWTATVSDKEKPKAEFNPTIEIVLGFRPPKRSKYSREKIVPRKLRVFSNNAELMTTVSGNRKTFKEFGRLLQEYNLANKKLAEFSELDKIVYQNIKKVVKHI